MVYEQGEIVLIDFNPRRRKEEVGKVRPAVVISQTKLNNVLDLLMVVPLTTNLVDDAFPLRIRIGKREGLDQESDAMVEQARGVAKSRIVQKLCRVSGEELEAIKGGIKAIIGG